MANNKKINWLLILQGWAMLWVVVGHSPIGEAGHGPVWENALYHFAYSFHMPLFMLVSGWLFYLTRLSESGLSGGGKKWSFSAIVKDKAIRLLLPGLVFSIVALALKLAFPGEMSRQTGLNLQELTHAYLYPYDNPLRELWFIITLFGLMLLAPLWKLILSDRWSKWIVLFVLAAFHFVHPEIELLCIDRVFNHAIWFYLGLLICEVGIVENVFEKGKWLTLILGVATFFVGRFIDPFLITMGGILFSFGLSLIADRYIPRLFCGFRNYTYQIFLMGIFVQIAVKIAYRNIEMPYMLAFVLCIVVGLYVPVLISKIIEKINWKPLKLCVGLK